MVNVGVFEYADTGPGERKYAVGWAASGAIDDGTGNVIPDWNMTQPTIISWTYETRYELGIANSMNAVEGDPADYYLPGTHINTGVSEFVPVAPGVSIPLHRLRGHRSHNRRFRICRSRVLPQSADLSHLAVAASVRAFHKRELRHRYTSGWLLVRRRCAGHTRRYPAGRQQPTEIQLGGRTRLGRYRKRLR
ncbi:MAG: hypothetical protein U5N86_08490 [Planctomycetota bacterium]|nr:hypothetical protein [Planctomycetota bacterium]